MSDPSADEKRLAEIRQRAYGGLLLTGDDALVLVRLLDAAQAQVEALSKYATLCGTAHEAAEERASALERERDGWKDTAEQHCRNEFFYHDLVTKIGEPFGVAAKTSDDGSIQQDVLALKVPELVEQLRERAEALAGMLTNALAMLDHYDGQALSFAAMMRVALSSTTPKCPQDENAPQATESHEDRNKS